MGNWNRQHICYSLYVSKEEGKNASSVLRHFALSWWESLDPLDKPQSWDDMKCLVRVTFINSPPSLNSYDEVNFLEEETVVISLTMPNLL